MFWNFTPRTMRPSLARLCHTLLFAALFELLQAQKPYFQQEVNYIIKVELNDRQHTLQGEVQMEYVNHAPEALAEIRMHLWANAFKNRRSAFCKQKLRDGDARFYFAADSTLGYFKNLDFQVDGARASWKIDPHNPDIAVIRLAQPLPPGARIHILTPFLLKIPASFSRLGHIETSYQMTQWYPKPAVYDRAGWHDMPYLDIGEFYSEFGRFDVTITLPENYVVGATGALQTPAEQVFLRQKELETRDLMARYKEPGGIRPDKRTGVTIQPKSKSMADTFPPSSQALKTIRYTAENVHDFAWFADKRFFVLCDTARLNSGKQVECRAMFTAEDFELWRKGAFYVRRAVEFYSQKVGEYPWPHATAVHSALSAGSGMEYPMITVIGDEDHAKGLDEVIAHEVGHNWFYGILGSNEREHPFLDEGINTYYEWRYMKRYYGSSVAEELLPRRLYDPAKLGSLLETAYLMLARENKDTPPDTHSDKFSPIGYGLQVYMKTALCMHWLEQTVGADRFDLYMQSYFRQWRFKHPAPVDLRDSWRLSGLQADWWFEAMQTRKKTDYALKQVKKTKAGYDLTFENKQTLDGPFALTALKDNQVVGNLWVFPAAEKRQTVSMAVDDADRFVIDYERITLDINRKNNFRRTRGLFPGLEPLRLKPAIFENATRSTLGLLPWLGRNNYDKTMLGLVLYNPPLPPRRLQYYLLPGFALGSKRLVGLADVRWKMFPGGLAPKVTLGISVKTFDFDYKEQHGYYARFYRVAPQIRAELRSASHAFRHALNFRSLFISTERGQFADDGAFTGTVFQHRIVHELRYEAEQRRLPNPFQCTLALEMQRYDDFFKRPNRYLRGTFEWKQRFYYQPSRKVTARVFAGYFFENTQRRRGNVANDDAPASLALAPQGYNDYRFDQVFLGRSETEGFLARQVSQTDGGFKTAFGSAFKLLGNSNNYALALNLKADLPARLPLDLPLRPYFDIGYFDDATPLGADRPASEQLLWSGGLLLEFFKGNLEIYFPLINSKNLKDRYCELGGGTNPSALFCGGNYFKWISWSFRLGRLDPLETMEGLVR